MFTDLRVVRVLTFEAMSQAIASRADWLSLARGLAADAAAPRMPSAAHRRKVYSGGREDSV